MFIESGNEANADPFSLASFATWLETKPIDHTYSYADPDTCLLAQYYRSIAPPNFPNLWRWFGFHWRAEQIAFGYPRTFGAALERARNLLKPR